MGSVGDKGYTYIPRLGKVRKSHLRVKAFGEVDELSSFIGYARSYINDKDVEGILRVIQEGLFHVGAYLALPSYNLEGLRRNNEKVEQYIERIRQGLPPLQRFIFPSGCVEASLLHVCRSITRRVERAVVRLADEEPVDEAVTTFLNKLSTLLFLLARKMNMDRGIAEEEWISD